MAKMKTNTPAPATFEHVERDYPTVPPKQALSQIIADRLGRGRLPIEQRLEQTDSWEAAAAMVAEADFDSIRLLLDGDGKAT